MLVVARRAEDTIFMYRGARRPATTSAVPPSPGVDAAARRSARAVRTDAAAGRSEVRCRSRLRANAFRMSLGGRWAAPPA
jgi:hypothetical protein